MLGKACLLKGYANSDDGDLVCGAIQSTLADRAGKGVCAYFLFNRFFFFCASYVLHVVLAAAAAPHAREGGLETVTPTSQASPLTETKRRYPQRLTQAKGRLGAHGLCPPHTHTCLCICMCIWPPLVLSADALVFVRILNNVRYGSRRRRREGTGKVCSNVE